MTDAAELVRRLRVAANILHRHPCEVYELEQDCLKSADALEQQAHELAAFRIAIDTRDKIARVREGVLRNSGNMMRDLNDLAKRYENELTRRGIPLPGVPDTRGTRYAGEVGCG